MRDIASRSLVLDRTHRAARPAFIAPPPAVAERVEPHRTVYDAGHEQGLPGDVVRRDDGEASGDAAVDNAFDWLGVTFELYLTAYGRNSIDGAGMTMESTVHYGRNYDNAFWNGDQMVYGDGDGELFNDFTGPLEVTGHELTHGVTQYTAGLEYQGQAGALNESVSDVFGSLIKQYHLSQTAEQADWLIGAGLLGPRVNGVALRSMKEPGTAYDDPDLGKDPQPATMDGYVETRSDNGGVHINSGIPNRAFYLVATTLGGYAWERAGRIWYETLTSGSLKPTATFADFAEVTASVAKRLFGDISAEGEAVSQAWTRVGVIP